MLERICDQLIKLFDDDEGSEIKCSEIGCPSNVHSTEVARVAGFLHGMEGRGWEGGELREALVDVCS